MIFRIYFWHDIGKFRPDYEVVSIGKYNSCPDHLDLDEIQSGYVLSKSYIDIVVAF
jgi:hypothetical protein